MKRLLCVATIAFGSLGATTALAADPSPVGDWMVKDGYGIIRIDNCSGKMWGILAWEKVPSTDKENPDPTKRARPTLGIPILMHMAPTKANRWEGEIYNTENGKTYSGNISLINDNKLQLEGCLFTNFLCGSQEWTRVTSLPAEGASLPAPARAPSKKGQTAMSDVCTRVATEEGGPRPAKGSAKK
jgi:uncharacterized protein (DUF2147 family)